MSKNQDLGELINGIKSLGTNQLNAPAYTSATSFTGTLAGLLGFDSSGNIITTSASGGGVTSFNTRTGAVTLSSSDVTTALGYTPYDTSNPAGYITGINSGMVTSALGYTPVPPSRTITINGVTYDLSADRSWTVSGSGVITGSGTNNYVTKWTGTTSIGIGNIQDTGTLVSINSETYVNGLLSANKLILYGGPEMIRMYASTPFISFYDATNVTRFGFIQAYAGRMDIVAEASNPLNFDVGGASRMRILTNGNVGIGTTAPSELLTISGTQPNSVINYTSASDYGRIYFSESGTFKAAIQFMGSTFVATARRNALEIVNTTTGDLALGTGDARTFYIKNGGNVGIGTSSPETNSQLTLYGSSFSQLHMQNGTTGTGTNGFRILMDGNNVTMTNRENGYLAFETNDTERLRITPGGGTEVRSGNALTVYRDDNTRGLRFYTTNNECIIDAWESTSEPLHLRSNGSSGRIQFITAGSERMRITSGGAVAIGTTSPYRGSGLNIAGVGVCISTRADSSSGGTHVEFVTLGGQIVGAITTNSSNTTYSTSSDYRLKYDYQDLQALDLIDNLKIYQYKWKVDNAIGYGVMAHELQEYLPYAVTGKKDGDEMQAVDYSKLAPIAIAGVKQLNKLFESHAEKIARLESEVAFLKSNIA